MKHYLLIPLLSVALSSAATAGTLTLSNSASPPTTDAADVFNFTASADDATNVNAGNDAGTYIASNRGGQGQTFTTGSNATGYQLNALSIQMTSYTGSSFDINGQTAPQTYPIRFGTLLGTTFTQIGTADSAAGPTSGALATTGANGAGTWLTFTLATPLTGLLPNTQYAFVIGNPVQDFFELAGTNADNYAGGQAITLGNASTNATLDTGDRVFVADLSANAVPEPSTYALVCGGIAMLVSLRRRRS